MLSLHELEVFLAAAELGTFSEAGRRLHISQPAVSQAIRSLERQFGTRLFVRSGRSVKLSEAGEALLPLAREALESARLVTDTMRNLQGQMVGELVLGCSTTSGKYLLPGLVAAFRRQYPAVRARIRISSRETVLRRLLEGQIPLGVVSRRVEHHELSYQPLFEDEVVLIVPADHPWARYGQALVADLPDQPLIMREGESGTSEVVLAGLAEHGLSPDRLNVVLEVGNAEAIAMAVEAGIGLAFVSRLAAAHSLALRRVRALPVDGLELRRTLYLVRSLRHGLTRAQERFWDFAREESAPIVARFLEINLPATPAAAG